jgi:hypothetical protein
VVSTVGHLRESKELDKLFRGELRGAAAHEARSKPIDSTFVPRFEPASAGWLRRTDTSCSHFVGIAERDVLDEAKSSDETGLVRLLGFINRFIKLFFR